MNLDVSYYIQGRINKGDFQNLPFRIKTFFKKPENFRKNINFKILNSNCYEISFSVNGIDTSFTHYFDSSSTNKYYSLKTSLISDDEDFISENLKD